MRARLLTTFIFTIAHAAVAAAGQTAAPGAIALPLAARSLDTAGVRRVRIAGTVTAVAAVRGAVRLTIANRIPGADASVVYVIAAGNVADPASLARFEPDDIVRVTGVVRPVFSPAQRPAFAMIIGSADDVVPIGWTHAMRRRLLTGITAAVAILMLLGIPIRGRSVHQPSADDETSTKELPKPTPVVAQPARGEDDAWYRRTVEEAPVGIVVYQNGRILFGNTAFAALFGLSDHATLIGTRLVDLVHRADRARVALWLRELRARRDGRLRARERFRRLDGETVEMEIVCTPTRFRGEQAVQAVLHDVTAHAALEDQLRHSQKMEAVGQLAAGVAHDFNNILTAIAGYSQLILDEYEPSDALRGDVEEIQRAGERAAELTKKLLAVSRRQLVLAEVVDFNAIIAAEEQLFRRTIGAQITLDVALADDACAVFGDRGQLEQIVMNLVLNACDAMPNGGLLQVETRVTTIGADAAAQMSVTPGDYVSLVVRDTGVGMSADTLRRIFDPFFTTKPVGDGTGLGLATMYGIIAGAHGHVSAKSVEGEGSEFTVLLPRVRSAPAVKRGTPATTPARGNGARVLLIEDEAAVRTAARRVLERSGYEVHEAKNGADAMILWKESSQSFDCVVSDVVLPGLRGPELVERFRFDRREIPVLFVSGYTDRALGRIDLEVPNTAFLQKPFDPKQLSDALAALLSHSEIAA